MNKRDVALELIKCLPEPGRAKCMLDTYSDEQLEKAMVDKNRAIEFVTRLNDDVP